MGLQPATTIAPPTVVDAQPESTTTIAIKEPGKAGVGAATVSPTVKAVAGSLGGLVEAVCLQPIDVIKTRLQLDHSGRYHGIAGCARTITAEEGVAALYKGLTPFAAHLTLKYSLRFGTNSFFQSLMRDKVQCCCLHCVTSRVTFHVTSCVTNYLHRMAI